MTQLASKHPGGAEWSLDDVQHLVLDGVSWELYEHLLKEVGSRPLRLTYDNGELEIMSPLPQHELAKIALGDFVKAMIEELDLPRAGFGSTTFRRRLKKKGLEPDDCFYIQSYSRIVGKKRITIPRDPPPDLAIEIDITHRSIPRLPIYAALGVPEVWRYDGRKLQCLVLDKQEYRASEFSRVFPKLRVSHLLPFLRMVEEDFNQTAAVKALRAWLRKQKWAR
jgi:Uma2 family endonuclease